MSAKLGLDGSAFERSLRSAKAEIKDFSEKGHSGFVHAGNGAREFHRTLHQITEASPVLGLALRAALSPMGAILTGLGIGFKFASEMIKEMNAEAKEMEKLFAQPLFNAAKAAASAEKSLAGMEREYTKFSESLNREDKKIAEAVADRVRDLKAQEEIEQNILKHKKEQGLISDLTYEKDSRALKRRTLESEGSAVSNATEKTQALLSAAVLARLAAHRTAELSPLPGQIEKAKETRENAAKLFEDQKRRTEKMLGTPEGALEMVANIGTYIKQAVKVGAWSGSRMDKALTEAGEATERYRKGLDDATVKEEALTEQWKDLLDDGKDKQNIEKEYRDSLKHYTTAQKDIGAKLRVMAGSPAAQTLPDNQDRNTVQELARSGFWWRKTWGGASGFQQGPFARQAQELERQEAIAKEATGLGNFGIAKDARARANQLRAQLENAGALKKDASDYVKQIVEAMATTGIPIQPKMGQ